MDDWLVHYLDNCSARFLQKLVYKAMKKIYERVQLYNILIILSNFVSQVVLIAEYMAIEQWLS